jgi:hypothetical protein
MRTVRYIERHDNLVKAQRFLLDAPPGVFAAGHKLDVVMTSQLSGHPGEIAIYGWHHPDGQPIQPLYVGATDSLVVFSHGIRLVDRRVLVDGAWSDLLDVWRDPGLAPIVSRGGVIAQAHYPIMRSAQ